MKTCKNGHKYDDSISSSCPYCPNDGAKTIIGNPQTIEEQKTVLSGSSPNCPAGGATRIENKPPSRPQASRPDKTRVMSPTLEPETPIVEKNPSGKSKLVGWIVTFSWDPLGEDYRIRTGKTTIGSSLETSDIVLKDALVSSDHAVLRYRSGVLQIRDNFSTNGTHVNGEDVGDEPFKLRDGDRIKVGNTEFKLRLIEEEQS